jgi:hypothetical protein
MSHTNATDRACSMLGAMTPGQAAILISYNPITNLSNYTPTFAETTLLRRGLKFIPASSISLSKAKDIFKSSFRKFSESIRWTLHHGNASPPKIIRRLVKPTTYLAEPAPIEVEVYLKNTRQLILKKLATHVTQIQKNIRKIDLDGLRSLCANHLIEVLNTDKGLGPKTFNRTWQVNEGRRQLSATTVYLKIDANMVKMIAVTFYRFVVKNILLFDLSDKESKGLITMTKAATFSVAKKFGHDVFPEVPRARFLPKIHKMDSLIAFIETNLKGRPIIGAYNCPTTGVSIWLHHILSPYTYHPENPQVLKDGRQLLRDLNTYSFEPDVVIVTADVQSLYPSIPIYDACALIERFLCDRGMDPFFANFVCKALLLVLTSNTFVFDGDFWRQLQGTAMGTHVGPCFAILFLVILEVDLVCNWLLFKRFLDDLFLVFRNMTEAKIFIANYNKLHPNIKLDTIYSKNSVDFLNFTVFKGHNFSATGSLDTKVFAKRFNPFMYLPFSSAHAAHQKKAFVKGLIVTIIVCSSHFSYYLTDLSLTYDRLRARGYPSSLLDPIFRSVSFADRHSFLALAACKERKSGWFFLNLPFNANFASLNVSSLLREHWDIIETSPFADAFDRAPVISWSKTTNVADMINSYSR